MAADINFDLRVNGINVGKGGLKLRRGIDHGSPTGKWQVVITDPILGSFAVDDNEGLAPGLSVFVIEVKDLSVPADQRKSLKNKGWKIVSVRDLLSMLETLGCISP